MNRFSSFCIANLVLRVIEEVESALSKSGHSKLAGRGSEDDDDKLRTAVDTFGEGQLMASTLEGRTATVNRDLFFCFFLLRKVATTSIGHSKLLKFLALILGEDHQPSYAYLDGSGGRKHSSEKENGVNQVPDNGVGLSSLPTSQESKNKEVLPSTRCYSLQLKFH
ncbi:hypothetical protein RHGRI_016863 [Rhododendron griersonianum]|uniref:Uncharacterized protein n=1 Tax=Rhododendron griersonianum TaxID=479676 RepID=A0AAV6IUY5_9ERIC|nr:hypothetical protein RHGRI_026398 [Rhododendron griersonianum]KAG5544250.1 hypothetical protein RHGRI_016863 [Rhododendron griersonianum]